jgi:hypothetical protein
MNKVLKITLMIIGVLVLSGGAAFAGWTIASSCQPQANVLTAGQYLGRGPGSRMGGGYGMQGGMMGNRLGVRPGTISTPLTVSQAESAAQAYLNALNLPDLEIAEVIIFDNNAYVRVVEKSTGIGAFELLVDPVSLAVYPEHGPNMMWNLKYGGFNHAGMMMSGSGWNTVIANASAEMSVTADQALQDAQVYLDVYLPGTSTAADADPFYGYYTIDVQRAGNTIGMLSVNGFSGQVFYHTWHGNFIEASEGK